MRSDLIDIACTVVRETEKGIAVVDGTEDDNGRPQWYWLPKSLVEVNDDGTVTMPERLAVEKGLC